MVRDESPTKNEGLLQLAERHQNGDAEEIAFGQEDEAEGLPQIPSPTASTESVITQVTAADANPNRVPPAAHKKPAKWKVRLSSLFCCLSPQTKGQYYRPEPELVVVRPPQPPAPPKHVGPAVLGPIQPQDVGKKCLVLDLDETLVHSSFKPVPDPDYIIPVEIEGKIVDVYVLKRPLLDEFMDAIADHFEIVVFTASLSKYADPLLDLLDKKGVIRWRLFRESCYPYMGNYVKNLLCLGRDLSQVIIVDNSPHSYVFQPANALPIGTFIDDPEDRELTQCLHVLRGVERVKDVRQHLSQLVASMQ